MPDFATRLKYAHARLVGTAPAVIPVAWERRCHCGATLTGERRTTWIQSGCPECGEVHFILPANVYPTCRRVPSLVLGGSWSSRLRTVTGELISGTLPPAASAESAVAGPEDYAPPRRQPDSAETATSRPPRQWPVVRLPKLRLPNLNPLPWLRRQFTPLRILILSAVLVAALTGWWLVHRGRLESARLAWRSAMDAAAVALDERDLAELKGHLEDAVAAAETLSRRDDDARHAENLLRQTTAVLELSSVDLLRELERVKEARGDRQQEVVERSGRLLAGEWFVFDCRLRPSTRIPDGSEFDLPFRIDGLRAVFLVNSPWLAQAQESQGETSLLLAAQVAELILDADSTPPVLEFRLDPNSVTLMTSEAHWEAVGFPVETDAVREQLASQDQFVRQRERERLSDRSVASTNEPG